MLSLIDLCLLSLRNSIENGNGQNLHLLPIGLRQQILDTILMHGTMDNPNCFQQLTSSEFLSDLKSLNTQGGNKCDDKYLNRIASQLPLDNCITELQLNLYGRGIENENTKEETNLRGILNLISRCPNLISLEMRRNERLKAQTETEISWKKSEVLESVKSIMKNLKEISLIGCLFSTGSFLIFDYPDLEFRNLTSLNLEGGYVNNTAWSQLLDLVKGTLTHLNLDSIGVKDDFSNDDTGISGDMLLQIPLPQLKCFKFDGGKGIRCTKLFVENLMQCPKLEYVSLNLSYGRFFESQENWFDEDENWLIALNQIEARLEIKMSVACLDDTPDEAIFDQYSRFKLVGLFKEKITAFGFSPDEVWNSKFTTALENVVDVCTNLKSFQFVDPRYGAEEEEGGGGEVDEEERRKNWSGRKSVNRALYRFFSNRTKVSKLRRLSIFGHIGGEVLMAISENCPNLDSLDIGQCSRVNDEHLIEWAHRGAKPSSLCLMSCENVGDAGLIPILISSGQRLKYFKVWGSKNRFTENTFKMLIENCRRIERALNMPFHLHEVARLKCFNDVTAMTSWGLNWFK